MDTKEAEITKLRIDLETSRRMISMLEKQNQYQSGQIDAYQLMFERMIGHGEGDV